MDMGKDDKGDPVNVSTGNCKDKCIAKDLPVMGVHGNECLCGDEYPAKNTITDVKACDLACYGFPKEPCGMTGDVDLWSVYNLGTNMTVKYAENDNKPETTSSSPAPTKTGSEETKPANTEDPASGPTSDKPDNDDSKEEKKGGSNVAGIAAGVVVGVVVIAALIGGGVFMMRRRRNAEIEEEHRRNAAVNAFISGAKPPGSSDNMSMSDSRLEPGLAHRRLSDGSIADNQDYSRKILRVSPQQYSP
jgi:cell wall integrity and stress response component